VQLIGSVENVVAFSSTPQTTRTIGNGPRDGEKIPVDTPTTIHALLKFSSGAIISYGTSWDVKGNEHNNMELYGPKGTLYVPDPNFFAGELRLQNGDDMEMLEFADHPFAEPNDEDQANYRGAGLADMAASIRDGREHRCNDALALHVVEVMDAILKSGETGAPVAITTTCDRPAAVSADDAKSLIA
jgi:predicted dehydrogenase